MAPSDHRLFAVVEHSTCPDDDTKLELMEVGGIMGWLVDQGFKIHDIVRGSDGETTIVMWNDNTQGDKGCYTYRCHHCGRQYEAYNGWFGDWHLAESVGDMPAVITEEE